MNLKIHFLLKSRPGAFKLVDCDLYRKSGYNLRKAIRDTKRQYRIKLESHSNHTNTCQLCKMKELVIDFRNRNGGQAPVCISGAEVEMVETFKFLEVNITNNLSWSIHVMQQVDLSLHLEKLYSAFCAIILMYL
eukprot:g30645.t1